MFYLIEANVRYLYMAISENFAIEVAMKQKSNGKAHLSLKICLDWNRDHINSLYFRAFYVFNLHFLWYFSSYNFSLLN
jgi:hypothetical protein